MPEYEVDVSYCFRYRVAADDEAQLREMVNEGMLEQSQVRDVAWGPDIESVRLAPADPPV